MKHATSPLGAPRAFYFPRRTQENTNVEIRCGTCKYIQGKDALLSTYDETKNLGTSFLFICSRSGEKACRAHLEQSFAGKEAAIRFEAFGGHSSEGEIQRMRDIARAHGIDCVAGGRRLGHRHGQGYGLL